MPTSGQLDTSWGPISFELADDVAPESCQAFIECILHGEYTGGQFFRTVRSDNDQGHPQIDVVQAHASDEKPARKVRHESTQRTALRHQEGTLSLPRNAPGSGTGAGFFICLRDTPALDHGGKRNPDGEGFAAFGRITEGMDIIRRIHSAPCQTGGPDPYLEGQLLLAPVVIQTASVTRLDLIPPT
ncbi:peptidylprolyl isomerase [Paenarthrobacter sp. NPDC091669]|uniref:peptidylprolyl isomerase n=1 Tax=Paenarthrobacter sp. NPDC091669 TaxID=3364384 RepID=UPI00380E6739